MPKTCIKCLNTKALSQFPSNGKHYVRPRCKQCEKPRHLARAYLCSEKARVKSSKYYYENQDQVKANRLKKIFGISLKQYQDMYFSQGGVCAICLKSEWVKRSGKVRSLCVDHCHATGKVRGLLCANCNKGIGHLKDNSENLRRAIKYLSAP